MSLHSVRPIVSRMYVPDVITETTTVVTWEFRRMHDSRVEFRLHTMQFRRNKRSRLQVRALRDVL